MLLVTQVIAAIFPQVLLHGFDGALLQFQSLAAVKIIN